MLATSVSQNLLTELDLISEVELFCAPELPPPAPALEPLTWVERFDWLCASRDRFT